MVTGGGQPGPFGINTVISRIGGRPRELIMKPDLLPHPCRTHWIRAFTALELDPGFHGVPAGPAHSDHGADGAGVT